MLIDWVSVWIDQRHFTANQWETLQGLTDRIIRVCTKTGDVKYQTAAWDSIRSDSHQLTIQCGSDRLRFQGSPARVCGSGDTVFGEGASSSLDLPGCVLRMAAFVGGLVGFSMPTLPEYYHVTRVDVTGNLRLGDLAEVRTALRILRDCEGGRYRVSQQAGDTVYWSQKSTMRRGKAYAKGPHLRHLMKQRGYTGRQYTGEEIKAAEHLLRLELTLGRDFFRLGKDNWYEMPPGELVEHWQAYFGRMIGDAEMKETGDVKQRVMDAAPTEGQGRAAYGLWALIRSEGWEQAREMTTKTTWYRGLKILRNAGLGDADFSAGEVVQLRRRILDAQLVESWVELDAFAA